MIIKVVEYRPIDQRTGGNLRALVSVSLTSNPNDRTEAVLIHQVRIVHEKNKKPFCQLPLKTWWKDGKQQFGGPVIELPKALFCAIQRVVMSRYSEETGQTWN